MAETAVAILFPELEPLLGAWQRLHTSSGARGLPAHVTLTVPFADSSAIGERLPVLASTFAAFAPFEAELRGVARFPRTLYVEPEPAASFVALIEALMRAFPEFPPYGGEIDEIVPHVTVAQGDDALLDAIETELGPQLPVRARVERVWLVEDAPNGWRRHTAFPLERRKAV
jgi:2'-5' RNA ligase